MKRSYELGIVAILFVLDRVTKWYAFTLQPAYHEVTPFLAWDFSVNRGVAFGIASSNEERLFLLLSFVVALLAAGCCWVAYTRWQARGAFLGMGLLAAGALSNVIDRISYAGVIDFILLHYKTWYWPTFNIADMMICTAVFLILFFEE